LRKLVEPILEFARILPPLLLIPVTLVLVRNPSQMPVLVVAGYTGMILLVYGLSALRNVPETYLQLGSLLGASPTSNALKVQLPAIVPELVGGVRVAAALGIGISVVAEYLAAPEGIGRVMKYALSYSSVSLIVVGIVWTILLALTTDTILVLLTARLLRWTTRRSPWLLTTGTTLFRTRAT
jgi:ABC-type nitrate/sulfonate/bicarbonate transport system permease component